MNLAYLTTKRYPATTADHIYVREFSRALARITPFTLVVCGTASNDELAGIPLARIPYPFRSGRTAFCFLWLPFFMRSQPTGTVLISNDGYLLLLMILWNRLTGSRHRIVSDWHHRFGRHRDRWILRGSDRVVCLTHALRNRLADAYDVPRERTLVSPDAVDLAVFDLPELGKQEARTELDLPISVPLMVYTGRFTTFGMEKGLREMLASLREPGMERVEMVAVGGRRPDVDRYAALAQELGVAARTHVRGDVPQSVLARYQRAADLLVMYFPRTPHYEEQMSPMKLFEYLAAARPIIVSDLPSIREVLTDACAVFVEPGDPAALARAVRSVLEHPDEADRRAHVAYREAQKHTWDEKARTFRAFLDEDSATAHALD